MSSVEAKLAEFRAQKSAQKSDQERRERVWDTVTFGFLRRRARAPSPPPAAVDDQEKDLDKVVNGSETDEIETDDDDAPLTTLDVGIRIIQFLIWACLFALAIQIEFGAVFVIASGFFLIWNGLGRRRRGHPSAYSVFNPNFETIDGTLTAEQARPVALGMANMNDDEEPFHLYHPPPGAAAAAAAALAAAGGGGGERFGPLPHLQAVKRSCFVSRVTLVERARGALTKYVANVVSQENVDIPSLRSYLQYLPVAQKQLMLSELQANFVHPTALQTPGRRSRFGSGGSHFDEYRSAYLDCVQHFWSILYCSSFQTIVVPNLQAYFVTGYDRDPQPSRRLDSLLWAAEGQQLASYRPPNRRTQDAYAFILDLVRKENSCLAKEVNFACYSQRQASSLAEKSIIFDLITDFRNIRILNLGYGCDDSILREVGRLCRHVSSLTIAGYNISDKGLRFLCGFLDHLSLPKQNSDEENDRLKLEMNLTNHVASDICSTLTFFDLSNALHVTEKGIKTVLLNFRSLQRLKCQDSYFWRLLGSIPTDPDFEGVTVPLKSFECGSSTHSQGQSYLQAASSIFGASIMELVIWNFDPRAGSFSDFNNWNRFGMLNTVKLNNVTFPDLTRMVKEIGKQILHLEVDNFSIEEYSISKIDLALLCANLPSVMHLSFTMVKLSLNPLDWPKNFSMQNLLRLWIKGVSCESKCVVQNFLSVCLNLEEFYLFSKALLPLPHMMGPPLGVLWDDQHAPHFHQGGAVGGIIGGGMDGLEDIIDAMPPLRIDLERELTDAKLSKALLKNPMKRLHVFVATVIDLDMGILQLTEDSLFLLIKVCPSLERIGNLNHWSLRDKEFAFRTLKEDYCWKTAQFRRNAGIER